MGFRGSLAAQVELRRNFREISAFNAIVSKENLLIMFWKLFLVFFLKRIYNLLKKTIELLLFDQRKKNLGELWLGKMLFFSRNGESGHSIVNIKFFLLLLDANLFAGIIVRKCCSTSVH